MAKFPNNFKRAYFSPWRCFKVFSKFIEDTQTITHYSSISESSATDLFTNPVQIILMDLHQQSENRTMRLGPLLYHKIGNNYSLVNCISQPNKSAGVQKTSETPAKA